MCKVVPIRPGAPWSSPAARPDDLVYGAIVDEDGNETPITEAMIRRALAQLDAKMPLPCPHHVARRSASS